MIRRKFVSPISAFTQERIAAKRKDQFLIIKFGRREQREKLLEERPLGGLHARYPTLRRVSDYRAAGAAKAQGRNAASTFARSSGYDGVKFASGCKAGCRLK
jgi:hypothetical protein